MWLMWVLLLIMLESLLQVLKVCVCIVYIYTINCIKVFYIHWLTRTWQMQIIIMTSMEKMMVVIDTMVVMEV
jgi:hypothetical protein